MSQEETKKGKTTKTASLYQKLQLIQSEIKELIRTEENKGQRYFFFNELQVLQLLKPLLGKQKIIILLSDDESKGFAYEKVGNMYLVQYWKKIEIFNVEQPEERLTYYFAAVGQNTDPAKAKGSAETYAVKYFLSKLFLMPVKDESDPDYQPREETSKPNLVKNIRTQQVDELTNLFVQKRGESREIQEKFLKEVDKLMPKYGITGETGSGNLRTRLTNLEEKDYKKLWNWLEELKESG
jgi:hypothetical protein